MISTFNLIKLKSLLRDFYNLTQIRITVFDDRFTELASWPENIAPFCRLIRQAETEEMNEICIVFLETGALCPQN